MPALTYRPMLHEQLMTLSDWLTSEILSPSPASKDRERIQVPPFVALALELAAPWI